MTSISMEDAPDSSSTPIKQSESYREILMLRGNNPSVDDLLLTIDKNISTASLNYMETNDNSNSSTSQISDDQSPIKPLNLKQPSQNSLNHILATTLAEPETDDVVMEDIPKIPSFDELEYNTRINRTSSLSKLHGPRQMSLHKTSPSKLLPSVSKESVNGQVTRDNSPSKKSVCFEDSPPKVMEYQQLTPEHSDQSFGDSSDDIILAADVLESNWESKSKPSFHPLPPLPPKHALPKIPQPSSPQKETTLGSSDDDSQDFNLTKEDLSPNKLSLEQRLDLVLDNDEISQKVQHDESFRGSGSPVKPLSKGEEEFIYNIKTKKELEEEECLKDAASLFENDMRNVDEESKVIRLNPELTRINSNSSLKDEERILSTDAHVTSLAPTPVNNDWKNTSTDDLISQTTVDSYASASEIMQAAPTVTQTLPASISSNSITTLDGNMATPSKKGHKKSLSLTESISSGMSFLSSMIHKRSASREIDHISIDTTEELIDEPQIKSEDNGNVPGSFDAIDKGDSGDFSSLKKEESDVLIPTSMESNIGTRQIETEDSHTGILEPSAPTEEEADISDVSPHNEDSPRPQEEVHQDTSDIHSIQSSIDITVESSHYESNSISDSKPGEGLSLLDNQTREASPSITQEDSDIAIEYFNLEPPSGLGEDDHDLSFTDEMKGTGLFNSSDVLDEEYRSAPHSALRSTIDSEEVNEPVNEDILPAGDNSLEHTNENEEQEIKTESYLIQEPVQDELPLDEEFTQAIKEEFGEFEPPIKSEHKISQLPSFSASLFHDKEPQTDDIMISAGSPPTDYISIWNSQPKQPSPNPQYNTQQRKVSPPRPVLKLLKRTINDRQYNTYEDDDDSVQTSEVTKSSLDIRKRDSFVAKSFSRSSFIDLSSSRRSSIIYDIKKEADSSYLLDSELLPDLSTGSNDFANAFKEWELEPVSSEQSPETQVANLDAQADPIKEIWGRGGSAEQSRTPSVDQGKIESMINQTLPNGEQPQMKSSSAQANVVVVEKEVQGVDIEFDHVDSFHEIFETEKSVETTTTGTDNIKPVITEHKTIATPSPVKVHVQKPVNREDHVKTNTYDSKRLISGQSVGSGFDLNDEFDRALQLQDKNYMIREKKEVIVANSSTNKPTNLTEPEQVQTPDYVVEHTKPEVSFIEPTETVKSPLVTLANSTPEPELSNPIPRSAISAPLRASTPDNMCSVAESGNLYVKKRQEVVKQPLQVSLPSNDKGRLYVHINSLGNIKLDEIKQHKATFKLYIDNGKHIVSTAKLNLEDQTVIDKEFELAVEDDITDLHITMKVSYHVPENELVEVYEKTILNKNTFGRLIGIKPKYKVEKKYISRKRTSDSWSNKFANDGSFGKNKIAFNVNDNSITGKTGNYCIELFNEWTTDQQGGKTYKRTPYFVGRLDATMLYIPRTSNLESLPPSINTAFSVADHLVKQSKIMFEGYLFQEGGDCNLWKRRYFKLEGTKLIGHHDTTKKPRSQINLLKAVDVIHNGKKRNYDNRRSFTEEVLMSDGFKLSFRNGEIINFNAETTEAKNQWIKVLEEVIQLNKFHQPWVTLLAKNRSS